MREGTCGAVYWHRERPDEMHLTWFTLKPWVNE
jgi:hypothetical protein